MDEYTLYLDESNTHTNGVDWAFAIGGFIINNSDINSLNTKLNILKNDIWFDIPLNSSIILHEKDLKEAIEHRQPLNKIRPEYRRFRENTINSTQLYKSMSKIVKCSNIYTLGCVVLEDSYHANFPKNIGNEISLVCMQIILENFTHFLFKKNASGKIIYESRDAQDKTMLMRFYQVSSIGTMYVQPQAIQQRISQFSFVSKYENMAGLQVADFIPNQIARKKSGKTIKSYAVDLTNNILLKSYDGENGKFSRYGIKVVPRME